MLTYVYTHFFTQYIFIYNVKNMSVSITYAQRLYREKWDLKCSC